EDPPLGPGGRLPVQERHLLEVGQGTWGRTEPPGHPDREPGQVFGAELSEQGAVPDEDGPLRSGDRISRDRVAQAALLGGPLGDPLPEPAAVARPIDPPIDGPKLPRLARLPDGLAQDRAGRPGREADPTALETVAQRSPELGPAPHPRAGSDPPAAQRQLAP